MTTSQFITYLARLSNNTLTRQELLELTNNCQNEIMVNCNALNRVIPDYNLVTTSGTYEYELNNTNIPSLGSSIKVMSCARVYVKDLNLLDYNGENRLLNQYVDSGRNQDGINTYNISCSIVDAISPDTNAKVIFSPDNNPNTTTDKYFVELYKWVDQLDSENIQLSIPTAFQTGVLRSRIMMELELEEYGRSIEWEKRYYSDLRKFKSFMSTKPTPDNNEIQLREL